jgi:hypothetical protein
VKLEIVAADPLDIAFDDDRVRDWDTAWDGDDYSP